MDIQAGELRHKIVFENLEVVTADTGLQKKEWQKYYTCYCAVNNLYGNEYWAAAQQHNENTITFTTRWTKYIDYINDTKKFRIQFQSKYYDIIQIDNVLYENKVVKIKAQLSKPQK